ncbi:Pyridoxamine 5'-phosphate oxidase [Octadecabacter temperatus]|uniref:Pyridoxamine 5'-phosphate oxidase n=1 Tax=Octadecabacter temperatus TaxID=1458307 RepID=A0A0K0Y5N1_9RHOB|nr:pyridoxamine 5'-phosphate oxidase family protein [Octadecabacter temperatus]AKS46283.1 Pyridoxamine 5'-phosphate oxidase [Octadecabacter temperatus]SIO11204.1 Pyridoxamine 5'-phosphate oxidase [Octadecabacter temperatus]
MGIQTDKLNRSFRAFIEKQFLFFVATAAPTGRVNVSPKGLDCLKILSDKQLVWLNLTGSGNETAAHVAQSPRMTMMFSSFEGDPLTLRVYGTARVVHPRDADWTALLAHFPDYAGARNIFTLDIDLVTTSCGTSVPEVEVTRTRADKDMEPWYAEMGPEGVDKFWHKKNVKSVDGFETGIFEDME